MRPFSPTILTAVVLSTAVLVFLLTPRTARAEEGATSCHVGSRHVVVERRHAESLGSDFLITPREPGGGAPPCVFEESPAAFRIGAPELAYHFNALRGDHLVVEESTEPSGRLVVFDLASRRKVLDVAVGDDVSADDSGVSFWKRSAEGTAANCKDFAKYRKDGFSARIETRHRFLFATEASAPDGTTRCVPSP